MRRSVKDFYLFLGILAIASALVTVIFHTKLCLFQQILGLPCPSCGMTRAYLALASGNIRRAFEWHPLFFLVPFLPLSYFYCKKAFYLIIASFLIVWMLRLYLYFPTTEPMVWNPEALYPRLWRLCKQFF